MSSTHVVKIPTRRKNDPAIFPAWERNDGLLVDLRLFPADVVTTSQDRLVFRPSVLERDGIDPAILAVAARSDPPGWALLTWEDGRNVWTAVEVKTKEST